MIILFSIFFYVIALSKIYFAAKYLNGNVFFIKYFQFTIFFSAIFDLSAYSIFVYDPSKFITEYLPEVFLVLLVEYIIWLFVFFAFIKIWVGVTDSFSKVALNTLFLISFAQNFLLLISSISGDFSLFQIDNPLALLTFFVTLVAPLYALYYRNNLSKIYLFLAYILFLITLFNVFFGGSRYQLLGLVSFYFVYLLRVPRFSKAIFLIVAALIFITFSGFHYQLKSQAHLNQSLEQKVDNSSVYLTTEEDSIRIKLRDRVLHKWYLIGPVFNYINENDHVYFAPINTAIYSFIPSFFLNDTKAWPGSVDGNKYSSFDYLVNEIAFNSGHNMSEYPKSLGAIWQFGFLGIFLLIFSSIFFLAFTLMLSKLLGDNAYLLPLFAIYPFSYNKFVILPHEIFTSLAYIVIPIAFSLVFFNSLKKLF